MVACRPRVTPPTVSTLHQVHLRTIRGIKSKTAGRGHRLSANANSNVFGEHTIIVDAKKSKPLCESGRTLPECGGQLRNQTATEAQKALGGGRSDLGHKSLSCDLSFSAASKSNIGRFRTELRSVYGKPVARIALIGSTASCPQINSKADCDFVASYTLDAAHSVYIPGEPPRLSVPAASTVTLGELFETPPLVFPPDNALKRAMFASVRHLSPDFQFKSLDVFAAPSSLAYILERNRPFVATMAPGSPMSLRQLSAYRHILDGCSTKTASGLSAKHHSLLQGRRFEAAMTGPSTILPSKHFRIIHYMLGGLSMGVISEIDAWDPAPLRHCYHQEDAPPYSAGTGQGPTVGYHSSGRLLNNKDLVEIKICNKHTLARTWRKRQLRAWFSRIGRLYVGKYDSKIGPINITQSTVDLKKAQKTHQSDLQRLHAFLVSLKAEVAKTSSGIIVGIPRRQGKSFGYELYEVPEDRPILTEYMGLMKMMVDYDAKRLSERCEDLQS